MDFRSRIAARLISSVSDDQVPIPIVFNFTPTPVTAKGNDSPMCNQFVLKPLESGLLPLLTNLKSEFVGRNDIFDASLRFPARMSLRGDWSGHSNRFPLQESKSFVAPKVNLSVPTCFGLPYARRPTFARN